MLAAPVELAVALALVGPVFAEAASAELALAVPAIAE